MKRILLFICIALVFAACGGAGGSKLDIKAGGKDSTMNIIKSSSSDTSVRTLTDKDGKMTKVPITYIYLANFDLDMNAAPMRQPLTAADQIRVGLAVSGSESPADKMVLTTGTYKAAPNEKYNRLDWLSVSTFADGKEIKTDFDTTFSQSKITGEVRITSVTADSISGEIDVTDGNKSIKGNFTAKAPGKK